MHVQTVSGPVGPEDLGGVLMHEHLDAVAMKGFYTGGAGDEELVLEALGGLMEHGIGTVVDLTGRSRVINGHDHLLAASVSTRLGLKIVNGFSFYKDPWLQGRAPSALDELTALYIESAGGNPGRRAGVYGEVGTSLNEITPGEELHLRAVARAQSETGLAISTHCTLGTMAVEQVDILGSEGADPARIVVGHVDLLADLEYLERILAAGVNLAFDTFGKEWFDYRVPGSEPDTPGEYVKWAYRRSDDDRVSALVQLCERGFEDRIVLSCDMSGAEAWLNPETHGRHGYSYLPAVVVPRLREAGVTESAIRSMLVENPARILAAP